MGRPPSVRPAGALPLRGWGKAGRVRQARQPQEEAPSLQDRQADREDRQADRSSLTSTQQTKRASQEPPWMHIPRGLRAFKNKPM